MAAALEGYQRAAAQGSTLAMLALGARAELGIGLPQSLAKAAEWYQKAADAGDAQAQFKLGSLLLDGSIKRAEPAAVWFRRAAEQGTVAGQISLAVCGENGQCDIARNPKAARDGYAALSKSLDRKSRWRPYVKRKLSRK